jgi:hypothetical protein
VQKERGTNGTDVELFFGKAQKISEDSDSSDSSSSSGEDSGSEAEERRKRRKFSTPASGSIVFKFFLLCQSLPRREQLRLSEDPELEAIIQKQCRSQSVLSTSATLTSWVLLRSEKKDKGDGFTLTFSGFDDHIDFKLSRHFP